MPPSLCWASRVNLPIVPPRKYVVGRLGISVMPSPFDESFECGRVEWNYAPSSKFILGFAHLHSSAFKVDLPPGQGADFLPAMLVLRASTVAVWQAESRCIVASSNRHSSSAS